MICSNRKPLTLTLLAAYACVSIASAQRAGGGGGIYRDAPTVVIRGQGAVSGAEVLLNKIGHRVWQYLGIPFAKPPLGDLRFAPPDADPPPAWTGVRNGSAHVPGCIQDLPTRLPPVHKLFASTTSGQSEDCLYLNVYRPEGTAPEEKFPVMVWFHPGDFHWGTPVYWDASVLAARHKVIVVTTAYRLNILGFYTDNTVKAAGNWGLLDQATSLDWVQKNIDSFGGSSHNVTLFGQGSGAVSVGLHVVSPWSRNKFQRAISMSGNALLRTAVVSTERLLDVQITLANKFVCYLNTLTGCLRNIKAEELVKVGAPLMNWGPVIDGPALVNNSEGREPFLPDAPAVLMAEGRFTAIPHLIGYNKMEDAFAVGEGGDGDGEGITREQFESLVRDATKEDLDDVLRTRRSQQPTPAVPAVAADDFADGDVDDGVNNDDEGNCTLNADFVADTLLMRYARQTDDPETLRRNYVIMTANKKLGASSYRLASYVSRYNTTYVYRYEYKLRAAKAVPATPEWVDAPHGAELSMVWGVPFWTTAGSVDWTTADRRMSDTAMVMWTNFAKHADPAYRTAQLNVRWDEFQSHNPRVMVLGKVLNMSAVDQEFEFWNDYYPKVLAVSVQCCYNNTVESAAVRSVPSFGIDATQWSTAALLTVLLSLSSVVSTSTFV